MADPAAPAPTRMLVRIPMRRAPLVPERLRSAAFYGGLLVAWVLWPFGRPPPGVVASTPDAGVVLAVYVGVLAAIFAFHARAVRSARPEAIELREDALTLPVAPGAERTVTLPYTAVWGCDVLDTKRPRLVLHTAAGGFEYPLDAMDDAAHAGRVRAVIRERLGALPDGGEALKEFDARAAIGATVFGRVPRLPVALAAVLVGAYAVEVATGAVDDPFQMIRLGACVPALVRAGELYRLVSANLLHANLLHLALNGLSLFSLATALNYVLGASRVLLTLLVSGLVGVAVSAASGGAMMSVGASAAIFGLLGALLWVHVVHGRMLPAELRQTRRAWGTMALINTALPLVLPMIDWRAHVAGLLAGVVVGWLVTPHARVLDPEAPTPTSIRAAAAFMAAVFVTGAAMAARDARRPWTDSATRTLAALTREDAPPVQLNELAWYAVSARDASPALLRAAEEAAAKAVARVPEPALQDTRAQALHRLGRNDEAVALEVQAFDGHDEAQAPGFYATQLARFLAARTAGAWRGGAEEGVAATAAWEAGAVTVTLTARTRAHRVGVLVREGATLRALAVACFEPGAAGSQRVTVPGGAGQWRAEVALVQGVARCEPGATRAHAMAAEALALP
ncbi:MAG: rhomboid family intramembrane serine protease [Polyangiales bacterium]